MPYGKRTTPKNACILGQSQTHSIYIHALFALMLEMGTVDLYVLCAMGGDFNLIQCLNNIVLDENLKFLFRFLFTQVHWIPDELKYWTLNGTLICFMSVINVVTMNNSIKFVVSTYLANLGP